MLMEFVCGVYVVVTTLFIEDSTTFVLLVGFGIILFIILEKIFFSEVSIFCLLLSYLFFIFKIL